MSVENELEKAKSILGHGSLNAFLGVIDVSHSAYYKWISQGYVSPGKAIDIEALCLEAAGRRSVSALRLCPPETRHEALSTSA